MLRFRLFEVPVEVRPTFWLVALFLARPERGIDPREIGILLGVWTVVVFVSVLLHELGHALLARRYGADVTISLYALGGLTSWTAGDRPIGPWRRVAVAAAGSAVGIVLGGLALAATGFNLAGVDQPILALGLRLFVYVNLIWGALNWLPIRPLDGGHILTGTLQALFGRNGARVADVIFPIAAAAAAYVAWRAGLTFAALLAVFMLAGEFWRWYTRSRPQQPPPQPPPVG